MFLPVRRLIARQHGLVTYSQLSEHGIGPADVRRLLKAQVLVRVRHGVYADAELWNASDPYAGHAVLRVRAAGLVLKSGAYVFSHDSAALVLGMGAPDPRHSLVHVTRRKVHGGAVRGGVKHHLAPHADADVVEVDGLRVLGPARTALDMAREHGRVAGLAATDAALRSGVERIDLVTCLAAMWCWPRSRVMRWCVEMADRGAESYLESQGRDLVLELGIGRPETQFSLSDGQRIVRCDIRVKRHIFEVDGRMKYDPENLTGEQPTIVLMNEKRRQDFISGFKLGFSRITAHDCGAGRAQALRRLTREFDDTCARFGEDLSDLAPYIVRGPRDRTG